MRVFVFLLAILATTSPALADEVGSFRNDWTGNGIVVEAVNDPKVEGVTCHITRFERSLMQEPPGPVLPTA